MRIMSETNDGFELSKDLELRYGDFFGKTERYARVQGGGYGS